MEAGDDERPPANDHDLTLREVFAQVPTSMVLVLAAVFLTSFAIRTQIVALGLRVYDLTGEELQLGWLGLAEFAPVFLLAPFSGTIADRFDRRKVFAAGILGEVGTTATLLVYTLSDRQAVWPIYVVVVLFGIARSVATPAGRSWPVDLAPEGTVERIVAFRSVMFQTAAIVAPAIAGLLFVVSPALPFAVATVSFALAFIFAAIGPSSTVERLVSARGGSQLITDAIEGIRFIRRSPVLLGAISLDLFAVLLGGAVALLPAIGKERLGVDEDAVGFLHSAIGIGALATVLVLSIRPIRRHVGKVLLVTVAIFGVMTIVLGITTSYPVAFVSLMVLSGADAISVFIRSTLVPLVSPENMRGRVIAVESVFIGGSNELGAFESGVTAHFFGLVPAVVAGGVGTLLVVATWWHRFPKLRNVDRFEDLRPHRRPVPDTP